MIHSKVKNSHVFETYYKFKYPTHFQVRKNNIEGQGSLSCTKDDHVNMINHGQQSIKN